MAIIKPFHSLLMTCADCGNAVEVVYWNGVKNWDIKLDADLFDDGAGMIVTIIKVDMDALKEAVLFAASEGPHYAHRVVLWAKDQTVYDLLIATDPQRLVNERNQEEDAEEEDGDHTTTRH